MSNVTPAPAPEQKPPTHAERVAHKFMQDRAVKMETIRDLELELKRSKERGQKELEDDTFDRLMITRCEAFGFEAAADAVQKEGKRLAEMFRQKHDRDAAAEKAAAERAKAEPREPMSVRA